MKLSKYLLVLHAALFSSTFRPINAKGFIFPEFIQAPRHGDFWRS
jgi:hypothetical protein